MAAYLETGKWHLLAQHRKDALTDVVPFLVIPQNPSQRTCCILQDPRSQPKNLKEGPDDLTISWPLRKKAV